MSIKGFQFIPYPLPTVAYVAGGRANSPLRDIPVSQFGRLAHVAAISFHAAVTPTLTTPPTTQVQMNSIVKTLEIFDGQQLRFSGNGFNALRMKERIENGRLVNADPDAAANGAVYRLSRIWHVGPPRFAFSPSDFLLPAALLLNGEIRYTFGALTDLSADTTAISCNIQPVAWIAVLDELRIPPFYQWMEYTWGAKDNTIAGRAMNLFLSMADSSSYGAITAGDFGSITVNIGSGDLVPSIPAEALAGGYQGFLAAGGIDALQGEPETSADDNAKQVNLASPTALVAQLADLQMVLQSPPGARISKQFVAENTTRVRWDGSQASALGAVGRIYPQDQPAVLDMAKRGLGKLSLRDAGSRVKTGSKEEYLGPYKEFMPWVAKVA